MEGKTPFKGLLRVARELREVARERDAHEERFKSFKSDKASLTGWYTDEEGKRRLTDHAKKEIRANCFKCRGRRLTEEDWEKFEKEGQEEGIRIRLEQNTNDLLDMVVDGRRIPKELVPMFKRLFPEIPDKLVEFISSYEGELAVPPLPPPKE